MSGAAAEEIGVERDDDGRALDVVVHRHIAAGGHSQPGSGVHVAGRIPLMPDGSGEAREDVFHLRGERGRRDRFGENAQPCALRSLLRRGHGAHRADERRPRENLSHVRERLHAIGIVEIEQRGLREHVGRTEARRVRWVAFDLGRPPFVAFDERDRSRGRRASSPSQRTAAGQARCLRAGARTEGSARPAGACSPPCRRAPATHPSASGTTAARPHRVAPADATRTRRRRGRRGWRRLFPRASARIPERCRACPERSRGLHR